MRKLRNTLTGAAIITMAIAAAGCAKQKVNETPETELTEQIDAAEQSESDNTGSNEATSEDTESSEDATSSEDAESSEDAATSDVVYDPSDNLIECVYGPPEDYYPK